MKTITVSDEVYYKLEKLKGDRSFSELIDELIRANVSMRIGKILELGDYKTGREDELMAVVEKIRRDFKVRLS